MTQKNYTPNDLALIIRENSNLQNREIKQKINQLIEKYHPLVNKEAACFLLARQEDIKMKKHLDLEESLELDLENLVRDMDDVNIQVTVQEVFQVNDFDNGRVRNIKIFDETDISHLVVWDEDVEAFESVESGDVLRIRNAYSKYSDYNDQVEIHIGDEGKVLDAGSGEVIVD